MEIIVKRFWPVTSCTIGALFVDNVSTCFTLELPLTFGGAENVPNKTCIPPGRFKVALLPSPHFQASPDPWVQKFAAKMPHLVDVPGRSFIMIHWGDFAADTDGCILVGMVRLSLTEIGDSRAAFEALYAKLGGAINAGQEVWVTTENDAEFPEAT